MSLQGAMEVVIGLLIIDIDVVIVRSNSQVLSIWRVGSAFTPFSRIFLNNYIFA
jgi:hypothetical protein